MFVGSCSGTFYALDRDSGGERWSYDIRRDGKQTSFHGNVLIDKGAVLFGTDQSCAPDGIGHVYAADQATGSIVWKHRWPVGVSANLLPVGSSVCFGTTAAEWGCLDRKSGALRWKATPVTPDIPCELPTWAETDGKRMFVIGPDGTVIALRASDGRMLWKRRLGARATTAPIVAKGVLYAGAADNRLYSLDAATGRVLRSVPLRGRPRGRLTLAREGLFALLENDTAPRGLLVALDRTGKRVRWYREHPRTFGSEQPAIWRDRLVVGDCAGLMSAFSIADGTPDWDLKVTGCIRSITSSNDLLFIGTQEGVVSAVRP